MLFVLIAALWVRSKFANDSAFAISNHSNSARVVVPMFYSDDGRLAFILRMHDHPTRVTANQPWRVLSRQRSGAYDNVRWFWFHREIGVPAGKATRTEIVVRMWQLLVLFGVLPGVWIVRRVARKAEPGVCRKRGYCLAGNVSGVCPECGLATGARFVLFAIIGIYGALGRVRRDVRYA